jgi:hypothetical protein
MQQFGVHKPHDRTGVEQHYKDSNKTVPGENEIVNSNTSKTAESAINYRVNRNKLDIPVDESAKVRAQQFFEKVEKGLVQKQNTVQVANNEMQTAKQRIEGKVKE